MLKNIILLGICAVIAVGCSKPKNKEVSSEKVFNEIAEKVDFDYGEKMDLRDIKNSQRYGIATDKIKDGFAAWDKDGDDADNLIVLRVNDDKDVDSIEESVLAYINDMSAAWEDNEEENIKIENRVFKTIDKFVLLYMGDEPEKAKEVFEKTVKE